jgi:hypothetical protein
MRRFLMFSFRMEEMVLLQTKMGGGLMKSYQTVSMLERGEGEGEGDREGDRGWGRERLLN